MKIEDDVKLDFDDVLMRPKWSETPSRSDIDLVKDFKFKNGQSRRGIGIIASNMDTVGTFDMAMELGKYQMMTCLHKHIPIRDLFNWYESNEFRDMKSKYVFLTCGVNEDDGLKLESLANNIGRENIRNICIDVANGYTEFFVDNVKEVRERFPSAVIMAGNVATPEMVSVLLITAGVDIVKVGIGPGSVCTTRIMTGVGYPQLSAIIECADAAHGLGGHICADGGCKNSGDVAKAFGAGADFVMLGGMLAGHDECGSVGDGETVPFYGMSSEHAHDRYNGGLGSYRAAEGKKVEIPYKGSVAKTIQSIRGGLASACSYVGARDLKSLPKCCTFVRVNRTHNEVYGK